MTAPAWYWEDKDPGDSRRFVAPWNDLAPDPIVSVAWEVPGTLEGGTLSHLGYSASIWLSGGTAGRAYRIGCTVTTASGQVIQRFAELNVVEMGALATPAEGATGTVDAESPNSPLPYALSAAAAAALIQDGALHVEAVIVPAADLDQGGSETAYIMAGASSEGEMGLRWVGSTNAHNARMRGSDFIGTTDAAVQTVAGPPVRQARAGDYLYESLWYKPLDLHGRGAGHNSGVNGCFGYSTVIASTGGALARPTSFGFGGHATLATALPLAGTLKRYRSHPGTDTTREPIVEGLLLGDSIVSARNNVPPIAADFFSVQQHYTDNRKCFSLAMPAATIAQQTAAFLAGPYAVIGSARALAVQWVCISLGINSILGDLTAAAIQAELQTLKAAILARCPNALVLIGTITPCDGYVDMTAPRIATRMAVNAYLEAGSLYPVAQVVTAHVIELGGGTQTLIDIYNDGGNLHPNKLGHGRISVAFKAKLVAAGKL